MVLIWFVLLFAVSIGSAQVQKCGRVDFPAPVFSDGENLSTDDCGLWNKTENRIAPWHVYVRDPDGVGYCYGTLVSPTLVISIYCNWASREYKKSRNKGKWKIILGDCLGNRDFVDCVESGKGHVAKIISLTQLIGTEQLEYPAYIWKIEKVPLKKDYIWPICIFNKGNQLELNQTQQFSTYWYTWGFDYRGAVEFKDDVGSCLNQSEKFQTCDKVPGNFLCANFPKEVGGVFLSHEENNRYFFRSFSVEDVKKIAKFYYEIVPLLPQIVSLSNDIASPRTG